MKRIISIAIASLAITSSLCSCKKQEMPEVEYLPVTSNNISGTWTLVSYSGKHETEDKPVFQAPIEGTFMNVTFYRKDQTFEITTNLDSSDLVPHTSNGTFNIVTDDAIGSIIKGKYDHGGEMWSHDYVITDLTATTMTWTALDNSFYIQNFKRTE